MVRAFVAVDLPLPGLGPGFERADAPTHLTLAFLGDLPVETVPALEAQLRLELATVEPFRITARGMGAFPSATRPRIVWAGIADGAEALEGVAARVRGALDTLHIPYDRKPFVPHVTVLRVRSAQSQRFASVLLARPPEQVLGDRWVDGVDLKGSELGPSGAMHRTLARVPLGRAPG